MTHAPPLPDLSQLSGAEKDALIVALWTQLETALAANAELMTNAEALTARVAETPSSCQRGSTGVSNYNE